MNTRTLQLLLGLLLALALTACGSAGPEPTPTPTKTPEPPAAEQPVTEQQATPMPQPDAPAQPAPQQPAGEQATSPGAASQARSGTVNAAELNVRSGPGTTFAVVEVLRQGQQVEVLATSDDGQWIQVGRDGQTLGWTSLQFVTVAEGVATADQPAAPAQPPTGQTASYLPATMTQADYGAQAFLWWRPEVSDRDLMLMQDAGFRWVKQSFAWETIEGAGKGQFDWQIADRVVRDVNQANLKLLARVGVDPDLPRFWAGEPPQSGDHFADFVRALAARYNCTPQAQGCIQAFQIWNEPNLAREWGNRRPNPAEYAEFLGKAYRAIKSVHPNAIVITAGMAPTGTDSDQAMPDDVFYERMYQAMGGNSNGYFDMLGVHGAGFAAPPETSPAEAASNPAFGGYRFFAFRRVEDIRAIMERYGDANKRVVILEFGWTFDPVNPDYKWHGADAGIDQFVQADYLKRSFEYAKANWPWVALMSMLTMPNLDWLNEGDPRFEEQYWWAIMEPSQIDEKNFRAAYIVLCDYFNRQRGQFCPYDPARQ